MLKYSAKYFGKTSKIAQHFLPNSIVTLQFFQRKNNVLLCGINEVLELLQKESDTSKYSIKNLPEASVINAWDVVLELEGPYYLFGELEGIIDGILSRQTSLATNAYRICQATKKQVVFMGDRADHYRNQVGDGYAVALGGITTQVTDAQVSLHKGIAVGTMPHVLIQMFQGNLLKALQAYQQMFPQDKLTALVDFNNDVLQDSLLALKEFGTKLKAIRIDTSAKLSDAMFKNKKEYGVTPNMVHKVRKALDQHGGEHIKIIVSSGFDLAKIQKFEKEKAPVDIYGIGASLLKISHTFSADAVKFNGQKIAKVGRKYKSIF